MVAKTQSLALVILAACGPRPPPGGPDAPISHEVVDLVLPAADGAEVDFARWRGKPVAAHFARTSSLDSQADVEELRRTRARVSGLVLVEIVLDEGGGHMALPWADASHIDWAVLLPTVGLTEGGTAFGRVRVVPTTFLLDRAGRVSWRWEGALRRGVLEQAIAELPAN